MKVSPSLRRIWVLMATVFVDMMGFFIVIPLLAFYGERLGANATQVGVLTSVVALAQLSTAPLWGRLSDRYGRRPVILVGLSISAVAYIIFGLAQVLWLLFVALFVQGAGSGTVSVAQAYVSDSVPPERRAQAYGWLTAATSAGVMIGPAIGSLAAYLGTAAPGFVASALCLTNLLFASRWLPEPAKTSPPVGPRRSLRRTLHEVVRQPTSPVSSLIWIYALSMTAFMAMNGVLSLYLAHRFAITAKTIGPFFIYVGAVSVVMRALFIGWIVERLGEIRTMRLGAVSMSLGFLTIPLANEVAGFVVAITCIPVGTALLFPATTSLVSRRSPPAETGQVLGVKQSFRGVAGILGPAWAGLAFQHVGIGAPFWLSGSLMSLVALLTLLIRSRESPSGAGAEYAPAGVYEASPSPPPVDRVD